MRPLVLAFVLLGACQSSAGGGGSGSRGEAETCAACHMPEFKGARHHVGERPTTCGVCHAQSSWHPSRLDHPWPLTGAHAKGHCFYCHDGDPPAFRGTPKDCIGCHRQEYDEAPHHERNPTTCELCHSTEAWKPPLADRPPSVPEPAPEPEPEHPPDGQILDASARTPDATAPAKPKRPPAPKPDVTSGSSRRRTR